MNPSTQKKLLVGLGIFSVALLIAVIALATVLGVQNNKKDDEKVDEKTELCTTKACIKAGENFNDFACGTFIKSQRIPDDKSSYESFDILEDKLQISVIDLLSEPFNKDDIDATKSAKTLYKSCLNEESTELNGEEKLKEFLKNKFDGWPIVSGNDWNENTFNEITAQAISRSFGIKQIVDVYIAANPKNPKQSVLRIQQPNWFFQKDYYTANYATTTDAYKEYMFKFAKHMGSTLADSEIRAQVEEAYQIEKSLAEFTLTEDQRRNATFENTTIKGLIEQYPEFKWKEYIIDGMFKDIEGVNMDENEIVLIVDADYFKNSLKLYKNYATNNKRGLQNMLIWALIKDRTTVLPKKYREAREEFDKIYEGIGVAETMSMSCAKFVLSRMDYAAGRLYVAKYFNEESKKAALEMISYIQLAFQDIIRGNEWMDEASKQKAIEKAKVIENLIGYPDFLFDNAEMNDRYKDYQFEDDDFFDNTMKVFNVIVKNDLRTLRLERNRKNWRLGPAVVNAFYNFNLNQIGFPAGIMQAPFYDSQYPNYLNFGGIGSVIGHEITHGFDDRGRQYDKDGIFFPDGTVGLWTDSTIKNYKERAKCIIDQYSGYYVDQIKTYVNGFQTQGENIADNGGIKESFYGYQKWLKDHKPEPLLPGLSYTQEQLFFINYAQVWCAKYREQTLLQSVLTGVHSPPEFRIRGPTSNFVEFSKAFKCKANTGNNPEKKCTVW